MSLFNKIFKGKKLIKFKCCQRGCEFEAEHEPEFCPVCNNPANFEILDSENKETKNNESEENN